MYHKATVEVLETGYSTDDGRILKEMRLPSHANFAGKDGTSIVGIEIDLQQMSVKVYHIGGKAPEVDRLFWALLADPNIREMLEQYQEREREIPYHVWKKEGSSGCADYFITTARKRGPFALTKTSKILSVSCFGKLTEKTEDSMVMDMSIGDFAELADFMDFTLEMGMKELRQKAGVEYMVPRLMEDFSTQATQLL